MGKYFILNEKDEIKIKEYKYSGSDNSFYYRFVLTPLNNFLMDNVMPLWIAPNVITSIGFVCCFAAAILTTVYAPTFTEPLPAWVSLFTGLAFFVYQTLDNLDGKQARKTGSSSPLGLLFDHGCDVMGLTLAFLAVAAFLSTGTSFIIIIFYVNGIMAFGFATWEHYHTGTLQMGVINGPSDGEAILYFAAWWEALNGPRYFAQSFKTVLGASLPGVLSRFDDLPCSFIIFAITGPGLILTALENITNVLKAESKKGTNLLYPFATLLPWVSIWATLLIWGYLDQELVRLHPRMFILAGGVAFAITAIRFMLTHICHNDYSVPKGMLFISPFLVAGLNGVVFKIVPSVVGLQAALAAGLLILVAYNVCIVDDMRRLLNIKVFVIPPPPPPASSKKIL